MRRVLSYPYIVSTLALLIALSGGAYAAGLVGTSQIKNGAVTTPKIHKHAVTTAKLAPNVDASILAAAAAVAPRAFEVANSGIQQIGPSGLDLVSVPFPAAGTYLVTGSLRVFSNAANPGHHLNCSMQGTAGDGIGLTNVWVESGQVEHVPVTGLITMLGAGSVPLSCQQISGSGEITATYDLVVVRVVPGP